MKINERTIHDIREKVWKFNSISFPGLEGFQIGSYLAINYYEQINDDLINKRICKLSIICRCLYVNYNYEFNKNIKDKVVLFYSHDHAMRQDYVDMMNNLHNLINDSVLCTGVAGKKRIFYEGIKAIPLLYIWWRLLTAVEKDKHFATILLNKLVWAYKWKRILQKNDNILCDMKGLVTIFDAREYENIVTQYCMVKGIKTATIQHGHFSKTFYKNTESFSYSIGYEGFVSNEMWLWGNIARANACESGVSYNRLRVVGYPKKVIPFVKNTKTNKIGVILDGGKKAAGSNLKLVVMATRFVKDYGLKLVIKPHPKDNTNYSLLYKEYLSNICVEFNFEEVGEYVKCVDASICCCSTVYIDLLCVHARVFRFKNDNDISGYDGLSDKDEFVDFDGLCRLFNSTDDVNSINRILLVGELERAKELYENAAKELLKK